MFFSRVEKIIGVVVFGSIRNVCNPQVANQDYEEKEDVDPWCRVNSCEDQFEEGECTVQAVLRDVGPEAECGCERFGVENAPVDDRYKERICDDARPEQVMKCL